MLLHHADVLHPTGQGNLLHRVLPVLFLLLSILQEDQAHFENTLPLLQMVNRQAHD